MSRTVKTAFGYWLERKYLDWQKGFGRRMTWAQFAQYIGVRPMTLNRWVRGASRPEIDRVDKMAEGFCDDTIYMITGTPNLLARQLSALTIDFTDDELRGLIEKASEVRRHRKAEKAFE